MTLKSNISVFIVENNGLFPKMLEYVFSKDIHYQFNDFKTAEECIRHLDEKPFVVLLDDSLPGMDSYKMLREIKRKSPGTYVVLLLDPKNSKQGSEVISAGMDDFIVKDNHTEDLVKEKLESFFNKKAAISLEQVGAKGIRGLAAVCFFILILLLVTAGIYYY